MKKIAIASAAMGGAALIAFGASGTFASFTDSSTESASAGAGTLVITSFDQVVPVTAEALDLAPGEQTQYAYFLRNDGSLPGNLTASVEDVSNLEDGCASASESAAEEGACDVDGDVGEFSAVATVRGEVAEAERRRDCTVDAPVVADLGAGVIDAVAAGQPTAVGALGGGDRICVIVTIELPLEAGNAVQGDSADFVIDFVLEQDTTEAPAEELPAL